MHGEDRHNRCDNDDDSRYDLVFFACRAYCYDTGEHTVESPSRSSISPFPVCTRTTPISTSAACFGSERKAAAACTKDEIACDWNWMARIALDD